MRSAKPPRTHAQICHLAADAVVAIWTYAYAEREKASTTKVATLADLGLKTLAEALQAMGFRFRVNGKVGLIHFSNSALPGGREGRICLLAARFVASIVPTLAGHAPGYDVGKASLTIAWSSFNALSEALSEAGYFHLYATLGPSLN